MNKITLITRQNIADEIRLVKIDISGNMNEGDFLARLFNLKQLPSFDRRHSNAYVDIHSHSNWGDYEPGWMFGDTRFNLLHCDDEIFKKFLCETVHPVVCNDSPQIDRLIEIYNKRLGQDGFEMYVSDYISSMPVYSIHEITSNSHLIAKKEAIRQYLNTEYVRSKIQIMTNAIDSDTDLALGTAKELIETICKSILNERKIVFDNDWDLPKLYKEMINCLVFFDNSGIEKPEEAEKSLKKLVGGTNSIIQGIAELRNAYGTGHGKCPEFKGLPTQYTQLVVSIVSDIAIFILQVNGEQTEINS